MTDSSFSDDTKVASSPARSVPDAGQHRGRRRLITAGAVIVAALLIGGGAWWATRGGSGGPGERAPVLPSAFAGYKEAKPHDTEWTADGSDSINTDITKGEVHLTYRAPGGKALMVRAEYKSHATPGSEESDDTLYSIFDSTIDQKRVKTYPAGAVGGKIQCADVTIGKSTFTTCGWHDGTTVVTLAPLHNHHLIVSAQAPTDLRSFINSLHIGPSK